MVVFTALAWVLSTASARRTAPLLPFARFSAISHSRPIVCAVTLPADVLRPVDEIEVVVVLFGEA
jgi:hypothetical protein